MTFDDFKLHPDLMKGIRDMGYTTPTPIQEQAIPVIMEGKDLIGNAQTGTGKTAAFVVPMIHRFADNPGHTRALVLVPTRELAVQIDENVLGLAYHTGVKTAAVYGGVHMELQERAMQGGATIIAATPGRLLDHYKYGNWKFDNLEVLVMDEADRMLDMGFMPDIQAIIAKLPNKPRQTLLFSATMPEPIVKLAQKLMNNPVRIQVGRVTPPSAITQTFYLVSAPAKERLLKHLLEQPGMESVIVFSQTKIGADRLYHRLQKAGFESKVGVIHGGREQSHRDDVLAKFKSGALTILIATDVAARGIDIEGVSHVINYEVPWDAESYVHRIGRTARADAIGDAFTFVTPEEEEKIRDIEKMIGKEIPRLTVPGFEPTAAEISEAQRAGQRGGGGRGRSGGSHGGGHGRSSGGHGGGRGHGGGGGGGGHRRQGGGGSGGHGSGGGHGPSGGHRRHS